MAAPFLLLIAVGLLSAGVIRFVEVTAAPPIRNPLDEPVPNASEAAPIDPRQGWQGSTEVPQQRDQLHLGETAGVELDGVLPTSFLEAEPTDTQAPAMPRIEHGLEGPGAMLLPVIEYPMESIRPVPEPRSALLLAMGLGMLCFGRQSSGD